MLDITNGNMQHRKSVLRISWAMYDLLLHIPLDTIHVVAEYILDIQCLWKGKCIVIVKLKLPGMTIKTILLTLLSFLYCSIR